MPQQFDVVENLNPIARQQYPFLVVLQHDRVSSARTVVVAPLIAATPPLTGTRLHPVVGVAGRQFVILVEELAAIPRSILGRVIGSAEANRYAVVAAIDLLFTGI